MYPARISFKIDGEIKSFSDKQKLKEFSTTTKPDNKCLQQMLQNIYNKTLQQMLKGLT